jgi:hypothetical protein
MMKPNNKNPDLLLEDGAPVTCYFMARADAPIFWERCETHATEVLGIKEVDLFHTWMEDNPKAIIRLYPHVGGKVYLCDTHTSLIRELS